MIAGALLRTREVRSAAGAALSDLLEAWAGERRARRLVAAAVTRVAAPADAAPGPSLAEELPALVRQVDFAELKRAVTARAEQAVGLARGVTDELWRSPAKALCLVTMLPPLAGSALRALTQALEPSGRMPPDLLCDVVLSAVRELDPKEIAGLADILAELARKVAIGSVLIGEQGKPRLPEDLSGLVAEVLRAVDVPRLLKARRLLAEAAEATEAALLERIEDRPELARELLGAWLRGHAVGLRRLRRRVDFVERALTPADLADELSRGVGQIDAQEAAETLERVLQLGASDLRPLAAEVLPPVLRALAEVIAQAEPDSELSDAVVALRQAVAGSAS